MGAFALAFRCAPTEVCGGSAPVELKVKELFLSRVDRIRLCGIGGVLQDGMLPMLGLRAKDAVHR